jgi:hypothetical protein
MKQKRGRNKGLLSSLTRSVFGQSTCFLCRKRLTNKSRSDEHVFPKWLQRDLNLWDQKLTLLNGQGFAYRNLTIPACKICNNEYLGSLEEKVRRAFAGGYDEFAQIEEALLYQWLSKIFFGILSKEFFLRRHWSRPNRIVTRAMIEQYRMHHLFLQSICGSVTLRFDPGSLFIFRCQKPTDVRHQFDFRDDIRTLFVAMRVRDIGVVGILQDGGAGNLSSTLPQIVVPDSPPLHPIQFSEVVAHLLYMSLKATRTPKYLTGESKTSVWVEQLPIVGLSNKPLHYPQKIDEYARILATVTQQPLELIYAPPDRVMTWLFDPKGQRMAMPLEQFPLG